MAFLPHWWLPLPQPPRQPPVLQPVMPLGPIQLGQQQQAVFSTEDNSTNKRRLNADALPAVMIEEERVGGGLLSSPPKRRRMTAAAEEATEAPLRLPSCAKRCRFDGEDEQLLPLLQKEEEAVSPRPFKQARRRGPAPEETMAVVPFSGQPIANTFKTSSVHELPVEVVASAISRMLSFVLPTDKDAAYVEDTREAKEGTDEEPMQCSEEEEPVLPKYDYANMQLTLYQPPVWDPNLLSSTAPSSLSDDDSMML